MIWWARILLIIWIKIIGGEKVILGIGTDIIEIKRIEEAVKRNERFLQKCFTKPEQKLFEERKYNIQTIAATFAAKEAVAKALGTGFRTFGLCDIEILRDGKGKPYVITYGNAKKLADELNISQILITLSHCKEYAVAYAIVQKEENL
jgi:holo-[acyl-carrier protein] synthase